MDSEPQEVEGELRGLTSGEVEESRSRYGSNVLTPPVRTPWWKQYLQKFDDPVIRILVIAALVATGTGLINGHYIEGIGIICAILLSTGIAFLNEFRANREFDILSRVSDEYPIQVIRDNEFLRVPKSELVVGDLVLLEMGEEVPADAEVLESMNLQVDESSLTGESVPAGKHPRSGTQSGTESRGAYSSHQLLRGSIVVDGHCHARITAVGDDTEIGRTARSASEDSGEQTPLNAQLEGLSKWIGVVGFGVATALFFVLVARGTLTDELQLTPVQWLLATIGLLAVAICLIRVWLPIVYDAFELASLDARRPAMLSCPASKGWMLSLLSGASLLGVTLGLLILSGHLDESPSNWLPGAAAGQFLTYFMVAITVIVVAVPEGLSMSVTLSLAYSMRKMTKQNDLVRRMHACETIGAATVICSDKTGTLTVNRMRVVHAAFPELEGGEGQAPTHAFLAECLAANSTANLSLSSEEEDQEVLGNPTEGALLIWLDTQNENYLERRRAFEVKNQLTFSTERKFMATSGVSAVLKTPVLLVKGAPEVILERCNRIVEGTEFKDLSAASKSLILDQLKAFQQRGMRALAIAFRQDEDPVWSEDTESDCHGLIWFGFFAISDPVRSDVPEALAACRQAGILVKIVTGDNMETAKEVGRQIGLVDDSDDETDHMTGLQFEQATDQELSKRVGALKILSRARPLDKLRLVRLLQQSGHVVAVTGDGTNDAPALNHANVGLALGKSGSAVAKEASDIILLDDSFKSIVNAVWWGRALYQNIQKFIVFQLTINVAALGIVFLGPFIGVALPLTVTQMLWVNLIMDTFAALALATDSPKPKILQCPPRRHNDFIVNPTMRNWIFLMGGTFIVLFVLMIAFLQRDGMLDDRELTLFFTIFVMLQFWNLFNARAFGGTESAFRGLAENRWFILIALLILVGQILVVQFGGAVFRTVPLGLSDWLTIITSTSLVLIAGEVIRSISAKAGEESQVAC